MDHVVMTFVAGMRRHAAQTCVTLTVNAARTVDVTASTPPAVKMAGPVETLRVAVEIITAVLLEIIAVLTQSNYERLPLVVNGEVMYGLDETYHAARACELTFVTHMYVS